MFVLTLTLSALQSSNYRAEFQQDNSHSSIKHEFRPGHGNETLVQPENLTQKVHVLARCIWLPR